MSLVILKLRLKRVTFFPVGKYFLRDYRKEGKRRYKKMSRSVAAGRPSPGPSSEAANIDRRQSLAKKKGEIGVEEAISPEDRSSINIYPRSLQGMNPKKLGEEGARSVRLPREVPLFQSGVVLAGPVASKSLCLCCTGGSDENGRLVFLLIRCLCSTF